MPYLQVDLDGKRKWPMVAAGCGISEAQVCKGLLDLWETCWRERSPTVTVLYLECLFEMPGRGERAAEVLSAFGFLEASSAGYRVRGADKYLRIAESRSAGGHAAKKNLVPGARQKKAKSSRLEPRASPEPAEKPLGSSSALTPITEHQSPSSKEDLSGKTSDLPLLTPEEAERTDGAVEVVEYYCQAMQANGIEARSTEKRRDLARKRLNDGIPIASLKLAIDGLTWSDWHMGRDPKTKGASYTGLEYAIGSIEQVELMVQRVPQGRRGTG